jgi:membrane-bound lytic murein transglycosylase MltF
MANLKRVPVALVLALAVAIAAGAVAAGCSGGNEATPPSAAPIPAAAPGTPAAVPTTAPAPPATVPVAAEPDEPLPTVPSPYDALPPGARTLLDQPFTGDLDAMVERRLIRAGVPFNRTHYFIDSGQQRGIAYEALMNFEEAVNTRLKTGHLRVQVAFVPLPRDQMVPALTDGKVDLLAATLTVTPERQRLVDFSNPTRTGVKEIVVTGPGAPAIASVEDLSGQTVFVRKTSSYYEIVAALNARLAAKGKPPVAVKEAPENLEDDDILEMVNAGLVPATVVDDYLAAFWKQVFPDITPHPDVALRSGASIAVAVRKGNPKLKAAANAWIAKFGEKTAFANVLEKRYLQSTKHVKNAMSEAERRKFIAMVQLFRKYGAQYGLDPLLMAAQGYQESRLDQSVKSHVGAVGVMQLMPATGKEQGVGDIGQIEPNIHAGIKYMRFMVDQYYKDEPMTPINKALMTFASYNAGPGRVRQLRKEAEKRGLDRNVWFGNVERVASEKIGRETVQYVSNIYKYYVAYTLVAEQAAADARAASPAP